MGFGGCGQIGQCPAGAEPAQRKAEPPFGDLARHQRDCRAGETANATISARNAKNCQIFAAKPISAVNAPMASVKRSSISLRPRRSATRPHIGEAKAAMKEVTPLRMPDHRATALGVSTPSTGRNSGMIGLSTENAIVLMNWIPTIAQRVRCQAAV